MALTKISGEVLQQPINIGVITATSVTATSATFSDNVSIGAGATTAFFEVDTGNVGIGTDNPFYKFEVRGDTNTEIRIGNFDDSEAGILLSNTGSTNRRIVASGGDMIFRGGSSTSDEHVRITDSGDVGIGTTNPGAKLTVYGINEEDVIRISTGSNAGDTFANIRGDNESGIRIRGGGSYDGGTIELAGGLRDTDPGIIKFSTGTGVSPSERLRIDSSGRVGIGTDNPATEFHVQDGSDLLVPLFESPNNSVRLRIKSSSSSLGQLEFADDTDADAGEIRYAHSTDEMSFHVGNNTKRVGITSESDGTSNLEVANGNIVFQTSGTGIDFSATSNATGMDNELLDDYEEGTWTPSYDTSTTSSSAINYSNQTGGSYIKVGRAVYICGRIRTLGSQSLDGTGNIIMNGLPFAISSGFDSSADTQDTSAVFSVQQVDNWNESPLVLLGQAGFSRLDLYNGGTLAAPLVVGDFSSAGGGINRMRFSGFYFTDS